jgi:DNA-binding response OmpR family regulator
MVLQDTVLVVDDDPELRAVLKEALAEAGFEVEIGENGEEGLKKALEIKPNIILLDLVMPVMDGWEFLEHLHKDEWGKNARVIILTNADDIDSLSRAIEGRGYEYLVKTDWKIGEVVEKIREGIN